MFRLTLHLASALAMCSAISGSMVVSTSHYKDDAPPLTERERFYLAQLEALVLEGQGEGENVWPLIEEASQIASRISQRWNGLAKDGHYIDWNWYNWENASDVDIDASTAAYEEFRDSDAPVLLRRVARSNRAVAPVELSRIGQPFSRSLTGFRALLLARIASIHHRAVGEEDGDPLHSAGECLALCKHIARQGTLIEHTLGAMSRWSVANELRSLIGVERMLTAEQCGEILILLDQHSLPPLDHALRCELIHVRSIIDHAFDPAAENRDEQLADLIEASTPWGFLGLNDSDLDPADLPARKEMKDALDRFEQIAFQLIALPPWQRQPLLAELKRSEDELGPRFTVVWVYVKSLPATLSSHDEAQLDVNALRVICALEVYHSRQGEYPMSLVDLTPAYLDAIPEDPYTGDSLCYRRFDEPDRFGREYTLHSTGADREDNGGRVNHWMPYAARYDEERTRGYDLILNPPGHWPRE